jgi:uncharacterized membrane protein (UPF0127 family)
VLLTISHNVQAQVIFQREKLVITPAVEAPAPANREKEDASAAASRAPQTFMVEVRGVEALSLEYIHTLNSLKDDSGVMIALNAPEIISVPNMKVYTAVDVAFIDPDGVILQIIPSIVPAEINRDIASEKPISALLYLKAGEAKKRDIRPKDIVSHSLFNARPVILK